MYTLDTICSYGYTAHPTSFERIQENNRYQITAELEMRKESDLGGADPLTRHVLTHAEKEDMEENKFLEEDSALQEEGAVSDEDFILVVKGQLQRLRHLLSFIQQKQAMERHRLTVHAATNETFPFPNGAD